MIITCGICHTIFTSYDELVILPCHGFHMVCSSCVPNIIRNNQVCSEEKDNCWLFGKNCDNKYKHYICNQCESPLNVFHIPDNDTEKLVRVAEYEEIPFDGLSQISEIQVVCQESVKALEDLISHLNQVAHNCRISKIVGSSVGVAGSVLFIAGVVLSPFTFGASTPLMIVGGVAGGLGGGVAGGTGITELVINNEAAKTAENRLQMIINMYRALIDKMVALKIRSALSSMVPGILAGGFQFVSNATLGLVRLIQIAGEGGSAAAKVSAAGMRAGTIVFHSVGTVLAVIGAAIDIVTIVMNATEISADQESEYATVIRNAIKQIKHIEKISEDFISPEGDLLTLDLDAMDNN